MSSSSRRIGSELRNEETATGLGGGQYDVYICYFGEEIRTSFVEHVYRELSKLDVHAFYDTESVAWGDSITEGLQTALTTCKRVLLVVSESLIEKGKCMIEFKALLQHQRGDATQIIYPVLVGNIDQNAFCTEFPLLADVQPRTATCTVKSINEICLYIKEVCSKSLHSARPSTSLPIAVVKEKCTAGSRHYEKQCSVGNLRQLVPHFTGRKDLVNRVVDFIVSSPGCTICELGGTPGVGKSMVAIAVAMELQKLEWRIVYADLRDVKSSIVAAEKVLKEALLDETIVESKLSGLAKALKWLSKRSPLLLVLDGCDSLLESDSQQASTSLAHHHSSSLHNLLDSISQHYRDLKTLFTSSHQVVSFGMSFRYFQVPPLAVEDATEYLTKCSSDVNVQQKLLHKWLKMLAEQCGGFPIALNFVASIICTKHLSPKSVVEFLSAEGFYKLQQELSSRLPLDHFNCFSAAFCHLHSDSLRIHVACLTVFPGSFNNDAVSAVLRLNTAAVQKDVIYPLIEKCLIESYVHKSHCRYLMHSVVRQYLHKLVRERYHSDICQANALFTDYYIGKLKMTLALFWKDPSQALETLDCEWHNFETVISCTGDRDPSYVSNQLIPAVVDALPLLETRLSGPVLLELMQSYSRFHCHWTVRARLLLETAKRLIEQSKVDRALSVIEEAKELVQDHDVERNETLFLAAFCNAIMGDALLAQDKPVEAVFFLSKSWKLYESISYKGYQSIGVLTVLGRSYADLGQMGKAMEYYRKATQMCSLQLGGHDKDDLVGGFQRGIHPYKVVVLKQMGETESSRGNQQKALKCMDKAIKILSQLKSCDLLLAPILYEKGVTQLLNNQHAEAMQTIETSFNQTKQLNRYSMLHFFIGFILGKLKYNRGHFELACKFLDESVGTATHNGYDGDAFVEALAFLSISQKQVGKDKNSCLTYNRFSDALQKCGSRHCMEIPAIKVLVDSSQQFAMSAGIQARFRDDFDPPQATFCCCRYSDFARWHRFCNEILNSPPLCLAVDRCPFGHQLQRSPSFHVDTPANDGSCTPDDLDILLKRRNSVSNVGRTATSISSENDCISILSDVESPPGRLTRTIPRECVSGKPDTLTGGSNSTRSNPPSHVHRFLSWTSQGSAASHSSDSDDGSGHWDRADSTDKCDLVLHDSPKPRRRHGHRRFSAEGRHRQIQMAKFKAVSDPRPMGHSIQETDSIDGNESSKELVFIEDHFI